jgi:hypothetical protein
MSDGISPDIGGDIFVPQGSIYSPQGQDALANDLAGIDPNAVDDSITDGGQAIDIGEYRNDAEEQDNRFTAVDEVRAEIEREQTAEWAREAVAESEAAQQEQAFQDGLANYDKLPPEEQFQVSTELVGRGLEAISPVVNSEQAQVLNQELFAGGADAVPMASTLAFFANNVLETLANSGLTDSSQLTPELAQQLTDPSMAHLFATNLCHALRMPELLQDGIVDPMTMSATLLPHVPALLSGQNPDLFPREYKLQFARDIAIAFGQRQILRQIDPDAAVALFDTWSKWGGRLRQGLEYHRQQQAAQPAPQARPAKSGRSSRQTRPSGMFRNDDIFGEGMKIFNERHGGV